MITLGLQRISRLLAPLFAAHPTLPWKAIHIAGTNGKGSVAALLSTFLTHSGYKVGRFTSPHLIDRWDCITLDQRAVERDKFLAVERELRERSVAEDVNASEFEILTAAAFVLFTRERVDVAVVECGLGGRLDATNVLRAQDVAVCVLTKVGLDHTDLLGGTIEAIAREKAGIFKPGVPVVVDPSNDARVMEVVNDRLTELGCELVSPPPPPDQHVQRLGGLGRLGLAKHQLQNLDTALTAYSAAETRTSQVEEVKKALPTLVRDAISSLPGRLQWLTRPPAWISNDLTSNVVALPGIPVPILLDGAHNPQSAQALAEYIDENLRPHSAGPMTWVLSVKNDKDIRTVLSHLLRQGDSAVTCSFGPVDGMPWVKSMDAQELMRIVGEFTTGRVEARGGVPEAVSRAVDMARESQGLVCVAGSLYLASDVLRAVRDGDLK